MQRPFALPDIRAPGFFAPGSATAVHAAPSPDDGRAGDEPPRPAIDRFGACFDRNCLPQRAAPAHDVQAGFFLEKLIKFELIKKF